MILLNISIEVYMLALTAGLLLLTGYAVKLRIQEGA